MAAVILSIFMQNGIAHFKHVYSVGEKQIELYIASDSVIFYSPEPRMAFRKKSRTVGKT